MPIHQLHNSQGDYNYNAVTYENYSWYYHFHSNYELIYALKGTCSIKVDNHAEILPEGTFALILPNQLHALDAPHDCKMWVGVFSEDYIFRFASHTRGMVGESAAFRCNKATEAFFRYHLIEQETDDIYLLKSVFYAVCQQYLQHIPMHPRDAKGDNLFLRITDYVNENFRSPITLRQMAQDLGFEYHYLSRRFHEIFNMNFRRFINQHRINYANDLLQQSSQTTIAEIAYACGFQNVRNFNAVYKELNGCSPRAAKDTEKMP